MSAPRAGSYRVSITLMARRSSIALYPSAACSSGIARSKTLPGSIFRSQISWMRSGKKLGPARAAVGMDVRQRTARGQGS